MGTPAAVAVPVSIKQQGDKLTEMMASLEIEMKSRGMKFVMITMDENQAFDAQGATLGFASNLVYEKAHLLTQMLFLMFDKCQDAETTYRNSVRMMTGMMQ